MKLIDDYYTLLRLFGRCLLRPSKRCTVLQVIENCLTAMVSLSLIVKHA